MLDSHCSASDWQDLIGLPWEKGGQGPDAFDCWAFAAHVQKRLFCRPLPRIRGFATPEAARAVVATRRSWRRVDRPVHGDIVELSRHGMADHVGVWLDVDRGGVLHCQEGAGSCFDELSRLELLGWSARFWTPGARAARDLGPAVAGIYLCTLGPLLNADDIADGTVAAEYGIPLDVRAGDTVQAALGRAHIDPDRVLVVVRARGQGAIELPSSPDDAEPFLKQCGAIRQDQFATRVIGADEVLVAIHLPEGGGGGGSDVGRILLTVVIIIAAVVAAAYLGPLVGASLGSFLGVGTAAGTQIASSAIFAVVSFAGTLAINALLPPPSPDALRGGLVGEASPTFSAQSQASVPRPGAVIPVCLGRHIHLVDDASPPWFNFVNNIQFLHQTLCLGTGEHEVEEIRIGNTTVWRDGALTGTLPGIEVEIVAPGQPVTLFEEAVITERDVTGQALEPDEPTSFFKVTPVGIETETVEIDIGFNQLVRFDTGTGDDTEATVEFLIEAQSLTIEGQPLGDIFELDSVTFTENTRSAVRRTFRYTLPRASYQVRVTRTTPAGDQNTFDDAFWGGLRAILPPGRTYGDVQLLALRAEVGAQLAAQTARRISVVKTRKIPVYSDGEWSAPVPSRSIAWGIAEIARMHDRLDDLDIDELVSLDATWTARSDTLDVVIDQELSFWAAMQSACRVGRAQPDQIGRRIRIWRDEPHDLPRQLFSERNIIRGSVVERPVLTTTTRPGRLVVPFMDEATWRIEQVTIGQPDGPERQERYFGIANRPQLTREISHDWRTARYRSTRIAFDVELEGRLLRRGDPIAISHRQMTTSVSAGVTAIEGRAMDLADPIDLDTLGPDPVIVIAAPGGGIWGPARIAGTDDSDCPRRIAIDQFDYDALVTTSGDPTSFMDRTGNEHLRAAIGPSATVWRRLIVESVGSEREGRSTVVGLSDDPRAHADAPAVLGAEVPRITGMTAELRFDGVDAFVDVTVRTAEEPPTQTVIYEFSIDNGASWQIADETEDLSVSLAVPSTITQVRAAPVGTARGPYVTEAVSRADVALPGASAALAERNPGTFAQDAIVDLVAQPATDAVRYQWLLRPDQQGAVVRNTVQPELRLSIDQLRDLGGPWRTLPVEMRAVSGPGGLGTPISIELTNPEPVAPSGFEAGPNSIVWSQGEADVRQWLVLLASPTETVVDTPQIAKSPLQSVGTIRVRAVDAIGPGPEAVFGFDLRTAEERRRDESGDSE